MAHHHLVALLGVLTLIGCGDGGGLEAVGRRREQGSSEHRSGAYSGISEHRSGAANAAIGVVQQLLASRAATSNRSHDFVVEAAASPVFADVGDCRGIAGGILGFCRNTDCRAVLMHTPGLCESEDCRGIVLASPAHCTTRDCRAVIWRNVGLCESANCRAVIYRNYGLCR